jgi:hypothetical protein
MATSEQTDGRRCAVGAQRSSYDLKTYLTYRITGIRLQGMTGRNILVRTATAVLDARG